MNEQQELWCHGCGQYVRFPVDLALDGCHVVTCPNCGHLHYRIVHSGIITGDRWDGALATIYVSATATTTSANNWYSTGTASTNFTADSWANSGTTNGYW